MHTEDFITGLTLHSVEFLMAPLFGIPIGVLEPLESLTSLDIEKVYGKFGILLPDKSFMLLHFILKHFLAIHI